jgi:hypothetical protein
MLRRPDVGVVGAGPAVRLPPLRLRVAVDAHPVRWWAMAALITLSAMALAVAGAEITRAVGWTAPASAADAASLLPATALGPGWVRVPNAVNTTAGGCFEPHSDLLATRPASSAAASWAARPAGLPMATETVFGYRSAPAATTAIQSVVAALSGCRSFVAGVGSPGPGVPASVVGLGVPRLVGYLVRVRLDGVVGAADFVLARRGSHLLLVVYADAQVPAEDRVSALATAAVARLPR